MACPYGEVLYRMSLNRDTHLSSPLLVLLYDFYYKCSVKNVTLFIPLVHKILFTLLLDTKNRKSNAKREIKPFSYCIVHSTRHTRLQLMLTGLIHVLQMQVVKYRPLLALHILNILCYIIDVKFCTIIKKLVRRLIWKTCNYGAFNYKAFSFL